MAKSIGVFVDIARQFHSVSQVNKNARINYERYLQKAIGDQELHRAVAYGVQIENEAQPFISALRNLGYEAKYRQARYIDNKPSIRHTNWNIGLTMDVVRNIKFLNIVIIGSNDPELVPLIEWIKEQGVKVMIYSSSIHRDLRAVSDVCKEIETDVLDIKNVDSPQELAPESQAS
jgi:uncharacterized LabA/DUF88 family protein